MNNCEHEKTEQQMLTRSYLGETFTYLGEVCKNCDSSLWRDKNEEDFKQWLNELHTNKRHLFQIQYLISENQKKCLEKLNETFFGVDESALVRAITVVYLKFVAQFDGNYEESEVYNSLKGNRTIHKKVQFRPAGMQDIVSIKEMLNVKSSFVVEESLLRILTLSIETDEKMKDYWRSVVFQELETILKAA